MPMLLWVNILGNCIKGNFSLAEEKVGDGSIRAVGLA